MGVDIFLVADKNLSEVTQGEMFTDKVKLYCLVTFADFLSHSLTLSRKSCQSNETH